MYISQSGIMTSSLCLCCELGGCFSSFTCYVKLRPLLLYKMGRNQEKVDEAELRLHQRNGLLKSHALGRALLEHWSHHRCLQFPKDIPAWGTAGCAQAVLSLSPAVWLSQPRYSIFFDFRDKKWFQKRKKDKNSRDWYMWKWGVLSEIFPIDFWWFHLFSFLIVMENLWFFFIEK